MFTQNQALPNKELFLRSDIRTMKKDLARLRESDSLKEREKIIQKTPQLPKPSYQEPRVAQILPQPKEVVAKTKIVAPEEKLSNIVVAEKNNPTQTFQTTANNQPVEQKDLPKITAQPLQANSQINKTGDEIIAKNNPIIANEAEIKISQAPPIKQDYQQKAYFQKAPEAIKQIIDKTTEKEQIQRRKFMEDVEKWSSSGDKD